MGLMNPPCLQIRIPALPFPSVVRVLRQNPRLVLSHRQECVKRDVQVPALARGAIETARRAPQTHKRPPA